MRRPALTRLILPAALTLGGSATAQTTPAFPGAEGFGAGATMRKNNLPFAGEVYHVTSLADTNTPGTLRYGVRESGFPAGGRVVVFDVGGTINLTASLDIKNINGLYIAGQTAPSPITIVGDTTQITSSSGKTTQNVIVRNLAFRKGTGNGEDAITFAGSGLGTHLILDHVSASWAEDEIMSVANNNTNVTVQYSMINDALVSNHAYGSLIRPRINSSVTFHHNLYANNASRQARFGTYDGLKLTADFRNNVVYNWRDRASYAGGSSEPEQEFVDVNYVGNYLIAGPGTTGSTSTAFSVDKNVDTRAYQSGNFIDGDKQANPGGQPNGADTGWGMFRVSTPVTDQTLTQMGTPFATAPVTTQSAIAAYNQVINYVGSSWWKRDTIDARVIQNVRTNTGPTIGAAAPNAAELNGVLTAPTTSRPAGWDTDNDGMPNAWETAHGLNPITANPGADFDGDGYSNIEEYLNEAGAFPAPQAINWTGGLSGRFALNGNWDTWQPSRFDTVNVNAGKAIVDAVGQHAGTLRIGMTGGVGEVEVTGGWLDVAGGVDVGSAGPGGAGTLGLSGGSVAIGSALNLNATGTLVLGGGTLALNAAGQFNWNGGMLRTTVNQGIGLNASIGAAGGTLDTTDRAVTYSGTLGGPGGLTKIGAGTLTLTNANTHAGGTAVNAGVLAVANADALGTGGLTIANGAAALAQAGLASAPSVASLTINGTGRLDVNDSALVVRNGGQAAVQQLTAYLKTGLENGGNFDWQGPGISSTEAFNDNITAGSVLYGVGILQNNLSAAGSADGTTTDATPGNEIYTTFKGRTVALNDTLVRYTYMGDADLDGSVTGTDYSLIDGGFAFSLSGWLNGDFDYSGAIDGTDYALIDNAFAFQTGPLSPAFQERFAYSYSRFGEQYLAALQAVQSVPEPAGLGALAALALGLCGRQRKMLLPIINH